MTTPLAQEWTTLQNQYDAYERSSLHIKLVAIAVLLVLMVFANMTFLTLSLLLVFWLQDAIWKTFQSRIEVRLLKIEALFAEHGNDESNQIAFQFNREFEQSRLSTIGLIIEYLKQALRPTVAFPHVALVVIGFVSLLI